MPFGDLSYGSGATSTILHPLVAVAMLIAIALMFLLPRKYLIVLFLCMVLLVPLGQQLYVAGVHLYVYRIIILFGWVRMVGTGLTSKGGLFKGRYNSVDTVFILWTGFHVMSSLLLFKSGAALIYQAGFVWSAMGGYFLLRCLIQDDEDIHRAIKTFAVIAAIVALAMINEKLTMRNVFGLLGGVRLVPDVREGTIRANGPFQHAILAGSFGGTLLPLVYWLWKSREAKKIAVAGIIASTIIVYCAGSSTPLLAYAAGVFAPCLWPLRKRMRTIRWGIVLMLVGLQMVMKADVWWLIARVDVIGASSGYHRAKLVDVCIRHFRDWWLIGTDQMASWGWEMWDLSNQFVNEAETGGLAVLVCFIAIISICYGRLGKARKSVEGDRKQEWFMWALGAALFAHIAAFFGVNYWDQMHFAWLALLAIVSAATASRITKRVKEPEVELMEPPLAYASPSGPDRSAFHY